MLKKLRVYKDDKHPHAAQKPVIWNQGPEELEKGGPAGE